MVLGMTTPTPRLALAHDPASLVWAREQAGLSQAALARAAGISQGTMSQLESGKRNSSPLLLDRLAAALRCPLAVLQAKSALTSPRRGPPQVE